MSQPMKRYWVYHLNILDDKPSNEPCIKHEVFKAVYLAADVEAVEARVKELERFKQYVHQCVEEHGSYKP